MTVKCNNNKLLELYKTGKSSKYKLPAHIVKKFIMRVQILQAAETIHDLWKHPALKFEKLQSSESHYSIRINKQYRLEMNINWLNEEKTVGTIFLTDLSKHYE
ncbi:MAG TPA: type II toxin-antitoxin system RelE/ParE family toxin [Bacteroidales bacterium]|nr:type II toxin-antitoxin system RelE/ParE family toxin [Bacteroidales bacterium]